MANALGVFRDDFYNAAYVLTAAQANAYSAAGGTLQAAILAGALTNYVTVSGQTTAQSYATDTAANIISRLQTAVATAYAGGLGSNGLAAQVNPPLAPVQFPNLFNFSWTVDIDNLNTSSGTMTITGGTGVTVTSIGGLATSAIPISTNTVWVATVTSPTSLTLTRVV